MSHGVYDPAGVEWNSSLDACAASLNARMAEREAALMPGALDILHEARRLAQQPGSDLGPVVREMEQALRAQQPVPRRKRRRR